MRKNSIVSAILYLSMFTLPSALTHCLGHTPSLDKPRRGSFKLILSEGVISPVHDVFDVDFRVDATEQRNT